MKQYTVALIADDSKKEDLIEMVKAHREIVSGLALVATGNSGRLVRDRAGVPVTLMQSGALGGALQIGALVANGEIDAVIFLRDTMTAHPGEPDVFALLRVCDVHNVPLATNLAGAEAILHLMAEHPEALSGGNLAAQFIAEKNSVHG